MSTIDTRPARPGRFKEFGLLIVALAIPLFAWILVTTNLQGGGSLTLPHNFALVAVGAAALVFVAHLVIRAVAPWADPLFFPIAVALNGLGLVMIHRIDFSLIARDEPAEVKGQLVLSAVGIVLMTLCVLVLRDHRKLRRFSYISLVFALILLALPMIPGLGVEINGAQIWIHAFGFSYQPAELAKIFLAIFFSGYLVSQRDNLSLAGPKVLGIPFPQPRHIAPILVAWLACLAILAEEKDFGTALLFFGLFVAMLYVATERVSWIVIGVLLSTGGIYVIIKTMPHIQNRINIWLHALEPAVYDGDPGSYQLVQGLFGMANGGLFGAGWGKGYPALAFAANSDFIIPSLSEEIGLTGVLAILCLFLIFVARAFAVGLHLPDGFGKLLAAGLGFTIAIQCFVVVGGVTRLIPLTGLAMPFMALGGSALLTNWIIVGILIRMSDDARRPEQIPSIPISMIDTGELSKILGDNEPANSAEHSTENALDGESEDGATSVEAAQTEFIATDRPRSSGKHATSHAGGTSDDSHPTEVVHL
ncbi:MAG: FtsW/RodA/SpoVE family cell cycle protein [Arcanobacterium sp.]|nr:FtsW/RodA/SpoVE family cell cycle protein [Arcanobacterium sp.]